MRSKLGGTGFQAEEQGKESTSIPEKQPSGAKARVRFAAICGTTEVVP
jgi:hypothetical protein